MADVKIVDIDSEQWNIKDQQARNQAETNKNAIGILTDLLTTAKNNLVAAINELFSYNHPTSFTVAITVTDNYCALNIPIDVKSAKVTGVEVLGAASYRNLNLTVSLAGVKGCGYIALANIPNYNPNLAGKSAYAIVTATY